MKKYFETQFKNENPKPLSKKTIESLKGRGYYSKYKEGDVLVAFFEQIQIVKKSLNDIPKISMKFHMIAERDIKKLKNDFRFIEMSADYPVFEKIEI